MVRLKVKDAGLRIFGFYMWLVVATVSGSSLTDYQQTAFNVTSNTTTATTTSSGGSISFNLPATTKTSMPSLPPPTESPTFMPTVSPTFMPTFNPTREPSAQPTAQPSAQPSAGTSKLMVGAYYYPWHKSHFKNGEGYLRGQLKPRQEIRLGEYDDSQPEVIRQHLAWSRQANIGLWVTSWWGPGGVTDRTTRETILPTLEEDQSDHKIALLYETTRWLKTANSSNPNAFDGIRNDFGYLCQNYADHPNYYRIDGKPVVFIYRSRSLESNCALQKVVEAIQQSCRHQFYIVGDHVWGDAPSPGSGNTQSLRLLDAVTNYDVYGNIGRPRYATAEGVATHYDNAQRWKDRAQQYNTAFIPCVSPGYNDRAVRYETTHYEHTPLSRKLTADSPEGSLFAEQLFHAVKIVDPAGGLIMVNSFNEWHEDTQIEPCDGASAYLPNYLTINLDYVGYGTLYLDLIASYTLPDKPQEPHLDLPIQFTGTPYAEPTLAALYVAPNNYAEGLRAQLGQSLSPKLQQQQQQQLATEKSIEIDLLLSWKANIAVWLLPWHGQNDTTNDAVSQLFLHPLLSSSDHKILLYYNIGQLLTVEGENLETTITSDIQYLCVMFLMDSDTYFRSALGRPVLVLAGLTRDWLQERWPLVESVIATIRNAALAYGIEVFVVGDQSWGDGPIMQESKDQLELFPLKLFDGIMSLDVYGDLQNATTTNNESLATSSPAALDAYYERQRLLRIRAWETNCAYIPSVIPGYNDRMIQPEASNTPLARRLVDGESGSVFASSLSKAKHLLDSETLNLLVINSFNNFKDDTQIYPVYGNATAQPFNLTNGVVYDSYGETFISLLSEQFGSLAQTRSSASQATSRSDAASTRDFTSWCNVVGRKDLSFNGGKP